MQRTAEENADGSVYFITAAFRDYPSFADSIADHFAFLERTISMPTPVSSLPDRPRVFEA